MSALPMPYQLGVPYAGADMADALRKRQAWGNLSRIGQGLLMASAQGMPLGQGLAYGLGQVQQPDPLKMMQMQAYASQQRQQQAQQTARSKLLGGYDPQTGITWNTGRPGLLGTPQGTSLLSQAAPAQFDAALMSQMFPEPQEPTGAQKDAQALGLTPGTPEYDQYIRQRTIPKGTNVTLHAGSPLPKPPQGYYYTGTGENLGLAPIPGGPADVERQAAEEKKAGQRGREVEQADVVLGAIGRIRELATDPDRRFPITGIVGAVGRYLPGTPQYDAAAQIQKIDANLSFEQLNAMRQSSPTGGAVGNVTERELALLSSARANLDQRQSDEQFMRELNNLEQLYNKIVSPPLASLSEDQLKTIDLNRLTNEQLEEYIRLMEQ